MTSLLRLRVGTHIYTRKNGRQWSPMMTGSESLLDRNIVLIANSISIIQSITISANLVTTPLNPDLLRKSRFLHFHPAKSRAIDFESAKLLQVCHVRIL